MNSNDLSRRHFLLQAGTGLSAAWISATWPALVAAAAHARQATKTSPSPEFQFFTAEQAKEVEAIAARIIPSDSTPGAREAGVVYFIDAALMTFAADDQQTYKKGLPEVQARVHELFPPLTRFSEATSEQQDEVLRSFDQQGQRSGRPFRGRAAGASFFETVRAHTVVGFLIDPEFGGNRDGAGWKVIGHELDHAFQPPFGFYDKDYPGWQPGTEEASKSKA